ncbi:hypothetical protein CY34DRAFT_92801, partial [Suillus luteus UH-Slu-Lm8-n1]
LDEAIHLHQDALALRPPDHPFRSIFLDRPCQKPSRRIRAARHFLPDLNEAAIDLSIGDTLALRQPDHPLRSTSLDTLARILRGRFEQQGATCLT